MRSKNTAKSKKVLKLNNLLCSKIFSKHLFFAVLKTPYIYVFFKSKTQGCNAKFCKFSLTFTFLLGMRFKHELSVKYAL